MKIFFLPAFFLVLSGFQTAHAIDYPGASPGNAESSIEGDRLILRNAAVSCVWRTEGKCLRPVQVTNRLTGQVIDLSETELFRLVLSDGSVIKSSELEIVDPPEARSLHADPDAHCEFKRHPGRFLSASLISEDRNLKVTWQAELRDGGNAVRQRFVFRALDKQIPVDCLQLVEVPASDAEVVGTVPGSPIVAGRIFFCYERPHSESEQTQTEKGPILTLSHPIGGIGNDEPLRPGRVVEQTTAVGVVPEDQLRRGFLYYVERGRAHPYRPFLHYNSWYDICWAGLKINEQQCLDVIHEFGEELIEKRDVKLESFVWDDGWDDPKTLWRMIEENFPSGFSKMLAAARQYDSTLGVWMSPFGGYGKAKEDRLAYGEKQGFEIGEQGFLLSKPKYFERFRETCLDMIRTNGVTFFKFDGLARGFAETEAMIRLIEDLRAAKPDLFVSITTGTWPSPFWLWSGDSTWRGGRDMGWQGRGPKREQWITYRDMDTYRGVVEKGPLYPINSLMTQGFAHARHGSASECGDSPDEIRNELRSFFASGTCLQELYVTPSMMSDRNWDDLAETAKWAHKNTDVLVDTHWIGGDPGNEEPYGWASWCPRKGILAVRNPSPEPAAITVDIGDAFELPAGAALQYKLKSPWESDAGKPPILVEAGDPYTLKLEPFEVLVYDAIPQT